MNAAILRKSEPKNTKSILQLSSDMEDILYKSKQNSKTFKFEQKIWFYNVVNTSLHSEVVLDPSSSWGKITVN